MCYFAVFLKLKEHCLISVKKFKIAFLVVFAYLCYCNFRFTVKFINILVCKTYWSFLFDFGRILLTYSPVSIRKSTRNNAISSIRMSYKHYNVIKSCWDRGQIKRCAHIHSKPANLSKTTGLNAVNILWIIRVYINDFINKFSEKSIFISNFVSKWDSVPLILLNFLYDQTVNSDTFSILRT